MRSATLALLAGLALGLATAASARAQDKRPGAPIFHPPPRTPVAARLDYSLGKGAGNCPGEEYLRREIASRMGYDPFDADAKGVPIGAVRIVIAGSSRKLTGTYSFTDANGVELWTRTYAEVACLFPSKN